MEPTMPKVVGPHDGKAGFLGTIGVRFMIDGEEAGQRFSVVEHPMAAHVLAAPMHIHRFDMLSELDAVARSAQQARQRGLPVL